MRVIHTSPVVIERINDSGTFDDCLFFSSSEYSMGDVKAVYEIEIPEDEIITAWNLESDDIIQHIMEVLSVDEETALDLLTGEVEAGQITGDYEDSWFIQAQQGACAKQMGYQACEAEDEQGTVYIVPMMGREKDLIRVK